MELLIILFALGFLTIHAYEHKWFLDNLHNKSALGRKYAQNKWHFWGNTLRFYFVGSVLLVGLFLDFNLTHRLIPVMIITMLVGGYWFSWFLNKIRGLKGNHSGEEWWDRIMHNSTTVKIATVIVFLCSIWYFYNLYNLNI